MTAEVVARTIGDQVVARTVAKAAVTAMKSADLTPATGSPRMGPAVEGDLEEVTVEVEAFEEAKGAKTTRRQTRTATGDAAATTVVVTTAAVGAEEMMIVGAEEMTRDQTTGHQWKERGWSSSRDQNPWTMTTEYQHERPGPTTKEKRGIFLVMLGPVMRWTAGQQRHLHGRTTGPRRPGSQRARRTKVETIGTRCPAQKRQRPHPRPPRKRKR
mmetsp:Transcript_127573/g.254891  ORF Transcript_127573/g.254891 Transcript_127573/m.254891 type:complete len:214 (-) Transcript_127573:1156-1797(-)